MLTEKQIQDNKDFLDKVALETSNLYVEAKRPTGFKDSMNVSRLAYSHALAMLEVRDNSLGKLAQDNKLLKPKN